MKFLRKKSALNTLIWLIWLARFRKTIVCILAYQSSQDGWIEAKEYNFAQDLLPLWVASIKIFEIEDLIVWSLSFQRASSNCVKNFASSLISSLLLWLCTLMIVDSLEALIFDYGGFLRTPIALWLLIFEIYSLCFHHPPRAYPSLWYHCCQT